MSETIVNNRLIAELMKDSSITVAKGIGIILMVLGHSIGEYGDYLTPVRSFIYMFHMPLFFALSGYCFKEKYLTDFKTFTWHKVKGLYFPFVKYGLLFLLLHNVFYHLNIYNGQYGWRTYVSHLHTWQETLDKVYFNIILFTRSEQLLGGYWFIVQLFWASIIAWIVIRIIRNPLIGSCIVLIMSVLYDKFIPTIPYSAIGGLSFFFAFFFLTGYAIKKFDVKIVKYQGLLCVLVVWVSSVFWKTEMQSCNKYTLLPYCITAILGTLMTMQLSRTIATLTKGYFKLFFIFVGEHTLEILTWHLLCFKVVTFLAIWVEDKPIEMLSQFPILNDQNYPVWWLFYLIVGVGLPLLGVWIRKKAMVMCTKVNTLYFSRIS